MGECCLMKVYFEIFIVLSPNPDYGVLGFWGAIRN
jgi:hypothetical protein